MDFHIARNNQKLGVFPEADVRSRLQTGEILPSDLVWCEGMPSWKPAAEVFSGGAASAAVPPPQIPTTPVAPTPAGFAATPLGPKPENYLVWSILTTLFCCPPFGIVAIVFAAQVDSKFAAGDLSGAQASSAKAKLWCWISFGIGMLGVLSYFGLVFAGLAMGAIGSMPQ